MAMSIIVFLLPFLGMNELFLYNIGANDGVLVVRNGEVWRLFTSMFLHGGTMHIVMNMFSLYILGRLVEPLFSKITYLSLYIISGLFGGLVSIYSNIDVFSVGASGAIFGIFGVLIGFAIIHRHNMGESFKSFIKEIAILLGINLFIGLVVPNIDMAAHVGGLIAGFIGGLVVGSNAKNIKFYIVVMVIIMVSLYSYLSTLYVNPNNVYF